MQINPLACPCGTPTSTCSSLAVTGGYCASVLYTVVKHSCLLHYKQPADKNIHLPSQFQKINPFRLKGINGKLILLLTENTSEARSTT